MEFKLPIQHVDHSILNPHVMSDLELIESENTPICNILFKPVTPESKDMAKQWMQYYTTNTTFLKESVQLFKSSVSPIPTESFIKHWNTIRDNKEFELTYHFLESKWLKHFNRSPTFMYIISLYFIASPALFLISPIFMLLIPFVMLKIKQQDITWESYMVIFKSILRNHSLGGLIAFKDADAKQRAYLVASALFFCIQVYANGFNFYTFYKNILHIHDALTCTRKYMSKTIEQMVLLQESIKPLSSYTKFSESMEAPKKILIDFVQKTSGISFNLNQCGNMRAFFYEMYDSAELISAIQFSIHFNGFLQNVHQMKTNLNKKIQPCTFGDKTSFTKSYYPTAKPVKNSYLVINTILTGPNASGKTTMIKGTMINALLSQQLGCGFYKSAVIKPYDKFFSYINIPDTSGRDSLFQAEARRCKEIIDESESNQRILCIFDELFSGTNPQEACSSAHALLTFLASKSNFTFLLTTHFIDVCESLKNTTISMKHMKTEGKDVLRYMYKLENGISYKRGGIKVLEQLHFPDSILTNVKNFADK